MSVHPFVGRLVHPSVSRFIGRFVYRSVRATYGIDEEMDKKRLLIDPP